MKKSPLFIFNLLYCIITTGPKMMVSSTIFAYVLAILTTAIVTIFLYSQWIYQYWTRKNIPQKQAHFPFGNLQSPYNRKETLGVYFHKFYKEAKNQGYKHLGLYFMLRPMYFPVDINYFKNIFLKDFQYFTDRGTYFNENDDPLSANLVSLTGAKWRNLRSKLTPTFTSGKMRTMFPTLVNCTSMLEAKIDAELLNKNVLDIKEILCCFTTDIIGSCAFGLECNSFEDNNSPFRTYGKKVFESSKSRTMVTNFANSFPKLSLKLHLKTTPKDTSTFFMEAIRKTIDYREKNNIKRNDFLQLLMDMKNSNESLTFNEIAAQCFVFFLAGFETSSTTMTFVLYELAKHPIIQEQVRHEIVAVLNNHNNEITYDAVNEMKYLGQVIDEGLRKYPPVPFLNRICVKDYKVPDSNLTLEKGQRVILSILGVHYDPEFYPEPERFNPDRFSDVNKKNVQSCTYLPFGEGPRNCIGLRFGLMQTKVGLTALLRKYKFSINSKTKEPLAMAPLPVILEADGGIWLNAKKVD